MVEQVAEETDQWMPVVSGLEKAISAHGVRMDGDDVKISTMLTVDVEAEKFVGQGAETANQFLKRSYRAPYVVPDLA